MRQHEIRKRFRLQMGIAVWCRKRRCIGKAGIVLFQLELDQTPFMARSAIEAGDTVYVSVQLDHMRTAGQGMQAVNVLGDYNGMFG
jgi:hypothetical protein